MFFFFNDTATTEIYTEQIVGSVRCVQETAFIVCCSLQLLQVSSTVNKIEMPEPLCQLQARLRLTNTKFHLKKDTWIVLVIQKKNLSSLMLNMHQLVIWTGLLIYSFQYYAKSFNQE
eukprot:TRINITY_DN223_c0_g1_i10.p3 TRINITY_DN223_c0_g1~~TRINITY_DN223_c0_g1_i10.p3  ORF type:complete len:117 (-),score=27.51 TRINITY_DN223_c0_g1_i10:347-697(-)